MQVFRSVRQAGMIFIAMTSSNGDFYASCCERVNWEEIDDLIVKSITIHTSHTKKKSSTLFNLRKLSHKWNSTGQRVSIMF